MPNGTRHVNTRSGVSSEQRAGNPPRPPGQLHNLEPGTAKPFMHRWRTEACDATDSGAKVSSVGAVDNRHGLHWG